MASDRLRCLIVDYGGVLTTSVSASFDAWAEADQLDAEALAAALRQVLAEEGGTGLVHALERGELTADDFERRFAALIRKADGGAVPPAGLLRRAFAGMGTEYPMVDAVRAAKAHGLRTALLSNSWGLDYDRADWAALFDAVVISGEVGLRKPEPAIYHLAAERLGARPEECVFVDDLAHNVRGAAAAGMVGVHHTSVDMTLSELEALFGVLLHAPD
ncbi:MAG: putative hydrolase of the superfamily [Cryptosporangiaceae bacterium]|nr:putative hydrolase of the superfamily [Cryptosporangiaceae bacterium]